MNPETNIFTKDGRYLMLALDHRASFKKLINPSDPEAVETPRIIELKKEIINAIDNIASGLLIDVQYGLPAYRQLNLKMPFLLPAEKTGYRQEGEERITEIEYSAGQLERLGASGVKLLIYYNPQAQTANLQIQTAKQVIDDAHKEDRPLFLEVLRYGTSDSVAACVSALLDQKVKADVFKLEYPGSKEECQRVTNLLGAAPWILLSQGVNFGQFQNQAQTAGLAGCRGFLAGRALWKDIFDRQGGERDSFLNATLPQRFREISSLF